jgi:hypothetical protein
MTQGELFPDNFPIRKFRVLICKRCGHLKDSHSVPGEEDWGPLRPLGWKLPWPLPSYYKTLRCYERLDDGEICDCLRYLARALKSNPVTKGTACAACHHAKRDHHRGGCAICNCKKFVNPWGSHDRPRENLAGGAGAGRDIG